jgi:hypothetical protein
MPRSTCEGKRLTPQIKAVETTLESWASSLREVKIRMRPLFAQERAALNAGLFVDGLLGEEVFLLPTCRVTAMPSSIGRFICRRAEPTIRLA